MTKWYLLVLPLFLTSLTLLPAPALGETRATNAELAAQVRAAETAFAKSIADRDHAAFVAHLSGEALFFSRAGVLRGKEAVAAGWKPYYEGPKAPFSWAPEQVEVIDSGTLALSSGPVRDPDGKQIGVFSSIWRLESDGRWRVLFDKGCPPCECPPKP